MTVHERVRRKRFRRILKVVLILAVVFSISGLCYLFFFSRLLRIERVEIVGAETVDRDVIALFASGEMRGKFFGVIPKNHPTLLNRAFLSASLKEKFPRISEVSFRYHFGAHSLSIIIRERKPVAYWCGSAVSENAKEDCFLVDVQGVLYERASMDGLGNAILKIRDENQRELRPGMRIFSKEGMLQVIEFREKLLPEVAIKEFVVEKESVEAHYIKARTQRGWYAYFDTQEDVAQSVEELKTVLRKEIGEKENRLEYIDLRVPGRAYYKLR